MKKIMFNEQYGLESAVLTGAKDMTRRTIKGYYKEVKEYDANCEKHFIAETEDGDTVELKPHFEIGEKVAIAQCYSIISDRHDDWLYNKCAEMGINADNLLYEAGWFNKMFVKADLMPHQIRITDLWFERLQAISDEDCLKEGVEKWIDCYIVSGIMENQGKNNVCFDTPREAFAALIDRISGKGTWQRNPWVIAYTFELVK